VTERCVVLPFSAPPSCSSRSSKDHCAADGDPRERYPVQGRSDGRGPPNHDVRTAPRNRIERDLGDASSLGRPFLQQSDIVTKTLLVVLTVMSTISWYLITTRASAKSASETQPEVRGLFLERYVIGGVQNELNVHGGREPSGRLTAHSLHARHTTPARRGQARDGSEQELLTRTIRRCSTR
jgi:hypothetical protein